MSVTAQSGALSSRYQVDRAVQMEFHGIFRLSIRRRQRQRGRRGAGRPVSVVHRNRHHRVVAIGNRAIFIF